MSGRGFSRREFLIRGGCFTAGACMSPGLLSRALADPVSVAPQSRFGIAIIIDDIGYSFSQLEQFLTLRVPLTFAVLPGLPNSTFFAGEIHFQGHDVMLHQPMEPFDRGCDPGPGALYVGDSPENIKAVMEKNIAENPFAIGINNHMGSRFTSSADDIRNALEVIREGEMFFVDSLTSGRSLAYQTALEMSISTGYRNRFLDNHVDESRIFTQLKKLESDARRYGFAIGIGHPHRATAKALGAFAKALDPSKFFLAPMSGLMKDDAAG